MLGGLNLRQIAAKTASVFGGTAGVARSWLSKFGDVLSVKDCGAIGNGVIDDTLSIQAAIDEAIRLGRSVYFPAGTYKITSSLKVYLASTFITAHLIGESESGRSDRGVIIDHSSMATTPAIIVQGGRSVRIERMGFLGPNFYTTTDWFDEADFLVGGVRDSRYSPQCAICIDPFKNGAPADGGYPGYSAFYAATALATSRVALRDLHIMGSLVGVMTSPSGLEANADNLEYKNILFETVKVPLAFGELQSKGVLIESIFADLAYCVLDTWTYGARNGSAGFKWIGGDVSRSHMLLRTLSQSGSSHSITDNWLIQGLYAEGIYSIGFIGDVDTVYAYVPGSFRDCTFWLANDDANRTDTNLTNFAPLQFDNCNLIANLFSNTQLQRALKIYHGGTHPVNVDDRRMLQFKNCRFQGDQTVLFNTDNLRNISMEACTAQSPDYRNTFNQFYRLNQMNEVTLFGRMWPGSFIDDAATNDLIKIKQGMNSHTLGAAIAFTKTGVGSTGGTFVAPDATSLVVGDVIYITNHPMKDISGGSFNAPSWPLGVISAIAGGVNVTLRDVTESATTGNKAMSVNWYPMMHGPSTVTTINANPNIVIAQTGFANNWQLNNRIISANIPSGAYIVSGVSPNFVISKNATAGAAGTRCYDADATVITKAAY